MTVSFGMGCLAYNPRPAPVILEGAIYTHFPASGSKESTKVCGEEGGDGMESNGLISSSSITSLYPPL
jgi:hypothetical protein